MNIIRTNTTTSRCSAVPSCVESYGKLSDFSGNGILSVSLSVDQHVIFLISYT